MLSAGASIDHFTIMRLLGRGGMGEVYLARDTKLGRRVALKVVRAERLGSPQAIVSFMLEARTTASLSHPNIVAIHAVGEHEGTPYVALEYLEGQNLQARLDERLPSLQETLRIGLSVAEALEEAHAHGILHRDLKPANLIIPTDGRLRIVDFGLATRVNASNSERDRPQTDGATHAGGTPNYMAPEQWRNAPSSAATDIWALGVILFKLCSGRLPFEVDASSPTAVTDLPPSSPNVTAPPRVPDVQERLERLRTAVVSRDAAPRLNDFVAVPTRLSDLVARCLEKDPEGRPRAADVASVLRDLLHTVGGESGDLATPFRGLQPFTDHHSALFFGRDAEIDAFVEQLRTQPVLSVVGPSGAGKSSFVHAGVVGRLREQGNWRVLRVRPGGDPFGALAHELTRAEESATSRPKPSSSPNGAAAASTLAVELAASPMQLSLMLRHIAATDATKVLLFVDQLEELFTQDVDDATQHRFLHAVCVAADDAADPMRVVLSLRHEFVDRLPGGGELGNRLGRVFVLKPPDRSALRTMLLAPLERVGYAFEDEELADELVDQVQGESAPLPLLQFAVSRMWETRDETRKLLLRTHYEQMGGVTGALARHADALVFALDAQQRDVARAVMLRLVTADDTRRQMTEEALLDGLSADAREVLDRFIEARLVVPSTGGGTTRMLELAHESLITSWRSLAEWVTHQRSMQRFLASATEAAQQWHDGGEQDDDLWSGSALRRAERMLAEWNEGISEPVMRFVERSSEYEQLQQTQLEMLGAQFDARREARARRLVTTVLGGLWTFVPLITMQIVDPHSSDYLPLFALPGGSAAVAAALCLWKWEQLKRTAVNRWAIATIFLALFGQMALQLGCMVMKVPIVHAMNLTVLLWAMLTAMMTLTVDLSLFPIPLGYTCAFFLSAAYAENRHDVVWFMSGGHLVTTITVLTVWSPQRLARSLASYRRSL